ncbi:hypothetical protein ACHAWF_003558, partial [Thalassiosira exigua]
LPSRAPPSSSSSSSSRPSPAADRSHRLRTHARLRSYESKRRTAYESKLQSSSLYWRAFRTLVRDGLLEARRADAWAKGWTKAAEGYSVAMRSVGEWCIDEKGAPIVDPKKKRRHLEQRERAHSGDHISHPPGGGGAGGTFAGGAFGSSHDGGSGNGGAAGLNAEFYREETCGALVEGLAEAASDVAERHDEMIGFMSGEDGEKHRGLGRPGGSGGEGEASEGDIPGAAQGRPAPFDSRGGAFFARGATLSVRFGLPGSERPIDAPLDPSPGIAGAAGLSSPSSRL